MGRLIGGIAAGVIVAMATIMGIELIGHLVYPLAPEADLRTLPLWAQLVVLASWFLGALFGGAAAALVARRAWPAWLIAALVALGGIAIILLLPHPELMQVGAVIAPAIGGLLAGHFARARLRSTAAAAVGEPA